MRSIVAANSESGEAAASTGGATSAGGAAWVNTARCSGCGSSPKVMCDCSAPSSLRLCQGKEPKCGTSSSAKSACALTPCPEGELPPWPGPCPGGMPSPLSPPPLILRISIAARCLRFILGRGAVLSGTGGFAGPVSPVRNFFARSRSDALGGGGTTALCESASKRAYCDSKSILSARAFVRSLKLRPSQPTEGFSSDAGAGFALGALSCPVFFSDLESNPTAIYRPPSRVNLRD